MNAVWKRRGGIVHRLQGVWVALLIVVPGAMGGGTGEAGAGRAAAERVYQVSREQFEADSMNAEAAWRFGKACFGWADFARDNAERASIAEQGMTACRQAIEKRSDLAQAHHFLAMNLGQLARTRRLRALPLVDEMETALKRASELDCRIEHGSPDRSLGLLYLDAPGWTLSIGDSRKAIVHLEKAVQIDPDYPENRLCLLEALVRQGRLGPAQRVAREHAQALPRAKAAFEGPEWQLDWLDWDERWDRLQKRLDLVDSQQGALNK